MKAGVIGLGVIGSGVAGLTAAHVLGRPARVTLYEADDRFGGHIFARFEDYRDASLRDGRHAGQPRCAAAVKDRDLRA